MRGHIRRRGTKWAAVVSLGHDESGRRKQQWFSGFTTKKAATEKLTEVLGSLQGGNYVEPTKRTLGAFLIKEWLPSISASVRPSTWTAYRMLCEAHIIPALGTVPLQRLSAPMLNKLYADLLATGRRNGRGGLSARTVQYVHVTAHKALADAVRWQLLTRNVADQATPPRPQAKEPTTWTADELRAFLGHVEGDRLYPAFLLAATTGLRRGEVLGLRWRDVDLAGGRLAVTQTLLQVRNEVAFGTPKTAKGRRSVALDTHTLNILRGHRRAQVAERLAWGPAYQDADLVFAREDGATLQPDSFSHTFARHARDAKLPAIRLHDLRHTHATLALQAGVHPKVVSERLGHATVSITLDTYSHAIPAMQEEAAERVAVLVFGG